MLVVFFETKVNDSCSKVSSTALMMLICLVQFAQTADCMPVSTHIDVPLEVIIPHHSLPLLNLGVSVSPETPNGAAHENTLSPTSLGS